MIDRDLTRRLEELRLQIADHLDLQPDDPRVWRSLADYAGEQLAGTATLEERE